MGTWFAAGMRQRGRRSGMRVLAAWVGLALIAGGCSTNDRLGRIHASLQADEAVDFGVVSLGRVRARELRLTNPGAAPLVIHDIYFEQPALADYSVSADSLRIPAGDSAAIRLTFAPKELGHRVGRLVLETDSERTPVVEIEVWGEAVLGRADMGPPVIDFGRVQVNTGYTLPYTLTNAERTPADIDVLEPRGDDSYAFSVAPFGAVVVPSEGATDLNATFRPGRLGIHEGVLPIRPCPTCDIEEVLLIGEGIAAALVVEPSEVDFGYGEPGERMTREVTITNRGTRPVRLDSTTIGRNSSEGFEADPIPGGGVTLGQDESYTLTVHFTPPGLDSREGTLRVNTDDPGSPAVVVPLRGAGGGPAIEVVPNPLGYPQTGIGLSVQKQVSVRNLGHDPAGTRPLIIEDFFISREASEFRVRDARGESPPYEIQAGFARTLFIDYTPTHEGRVEGELTIRSNDPARPEVLVPLHASARDLGPCSYEVFPEELDFGAVSVDRQVQLGFAIRNVGENACAIANMRMAGSSSGAYSVEAFNSRLLEPGEQMVVAVTFRPDGDGLYAGRVQFDVTSPDRPRGEVHLIGRGVAACLEIDPHQLSYGTVGLACHPPTRSVNVRNTCGTSVEIRRAYVGAGATDQFRLASGGSSRTLAPGEQVRLDVTYEPTEEGVDAAPLYVETSVSSSPFLVGLDGRASLRPMRSDTFEQPFEEMVDVLIVMDNSGSMMDIQDFIGGNFERFMSGALSRGIDFQIAVTTTGLWGYRGGWSECPGGVDGGEAGRFFPVDNSRPRILTPTTPGLIEAFDYNVHVGICHWWEEGLEAARLALSPPLINNETAPNHPEPNDGNAGFLREEARLVVIYISDEEDHGTASPQTYVDHLRSLKPGRPDLVRAHAIVGFPSCPLSPSPGHRYMEVVNAMGGVIEDVCNPDWGGVLDRISEETFDPQTVYPISEMPDGRDISVSIDGVPVDPVAPDGSRVWRFDPTIGDYGAVVFEEGHAPGPGTTVVVTYPVPCP